MQDNQSRSTRVCCADYPSRVSPFAQCKLVRVVRGAVWDVAVGIRRSSATFGQWVGVELSEDNHKQVWIPPGFAHGFVVLCESVDFLYETTACYAPTHDRCIRWDDSKINIDWPIPNNAVRLSDKDFADQILSVAEVFNKKDIAANNHRHSNELQGRGIRASPHGFSQLLICSTTSVFRPPAKA